MVLRNEQLIDMYRKMVLIRRFEEKVCQLFYEGRLPGGIHLCEGQEATEVGVCAALRPDDYSAGTHRGHGQCIAKGADPGKLLAEIYGRSTGYCKGTGGDMHVADPELGILGGYAVVGGGIPVATGAGLSAKMRGTDQVAACFFGDGAANQGTFHESLNLASLWKLPVIYVCENNMWAVTTRFETACSVESVADRAVSYNMPGVIVDGNDVLAVYEAMQAAVNRARQGKGPTLLECKTYRIRSHAEGLEAILKDRPYREEAEVEEWRKRNDPITRFQAELSRRHVLTRELIDRIENEVAKQLAEAVVYAEESPWPVPEETLEEVFA